MNVHGRRPAAIAAFVSLALASSGCSSGSSPASAPLARPDARWLALPERGGAGAPVLGGCRVFPADNPWNTDVSQDEVDPNSANYLASMHAATEFLHPDFGHNPHYGIPVTLAPAPTPFVPMKFFLYPQESDKGPYPYPPNARIEGGSNSHGDRHVLVVHEGSCHLYETYDSYYVGPGWRAGNGATWDLSSNALRHICWTSADAAGLPITPGLAEVDEVNAGAIKHALRFTMSTTQKAFVYPARHYASSNTDPNEPPMGLRLRLKSSYDLSSFTGQSLVILQGLKRYGMMVADNGSDWYVSGATDSRWNDNDLDQIKTVPASAFEVVKHTGPIYTSCP
jgi:hypothetical protein